MNLREIISSEMSRSNTDYVREIILQNPGLFNEAFELVILNEEPVSRRAIWALDAISEANPSLMQPHIGQLIDIFQYFKHDGLKRHTLRILSRYDIPEDKEVEVLETCFRFLQSEKESIAARFFAMEILYNLSEKEKDLKHELLAVLEFLPETSSPGLKNHVSKLIFKLKKETNS
ncbi:MAG TPA: hypothetical protein VIN10_07940 [Bacteroidales bacterium]